MLKKSEQPNREHVLAHPMIKFWAPINGEVYRSRSAAHEALLSEIRRWRGKGSQYTAVRAETVYGDYRYEKWYLKRYGGIQRMLAPMPAWLFEPREGVALSARECLELAQRMFLGAHRSAESLVAEAMKERRRSHAPVLDLYEEKDAAVGNDNRWVSLWVRAELDARVPIGAFAEPRQAWPAQVQYVWSARVRIDGESGVRYEQPIDAMWAAARLLYLGGL